jgi:hypothetical protein
MAEEKTTASRSRRSGVPASDAGTRIQQATHRSGERVTSLEEAHDKGFLGEKVDPTPNEHYTTPNHHTNPPAFSGPDVS